MSALDTAIRKNAPCRGMPGIAVAEFLLTIFIVGATVSALADDRLSKEPSSLVDEFLYQEKTGQGVNVFDLHRRTVYFEGVEYMKRRDGRHSTEFAGQIVVCSNAGYFCIRGGIYAVIPRMMSNQTHWELDGVSCHSDIGLSKQLKHSIICAFKDKVTTFVYDQASGILRYGNTATDSNEFQLVGDCGLFGFACTRDDNAPVKE